MNERRMDASTDVSRFRCTECGDCCRQHRVPVTAYDLVLLVRDTALRATALVEWLAPDEIDMTGEPESFVVTSGGRRLPVLAFLGSGCRFLDASSRCSVYSARPAACRTFPLEVEEIEGTSRRRLTLLQGAACEGVFDGVSDERGAHSRLEFRQRELEAHVRAVTEWNRRQRRRGLAGKGPESPEAFLGFAMAIAESAPASLVSAAAT